MKSNKYYAYWIRLVFFAVVNLFCISGYTIGKNTVQDQVSGQVTDSQSGESMPGVNIVIKGTSRGTSADVDGRYTLQVESLQDTLVFSFIGYTTQEIPLEGRSVVDVQLVPATLSGEELVVVGYGTQKRSDLSSSVSSVSPQQLETNSVLPNAASALEGMTAGVSVTPRFGQPGSAINIRVRGSNTFGDNNPLVIIDGAPGNLNYISPGDIASIQVLKDAAAAAIYGSRAANGVVIVTTKRGQSDKVQVDIKSFYGIQSPEKYLSVTNAEEYARIDNALHESSPSVEPFPALSDPSSLGKGTDWQRTMYNTAPIWGNYVGISGGNKNSTYRVSGSFNKQDGIAVNTGYRKALLHYNGQQEVGVFTFGESISWVDENQQPMPGGGDKDMTQQILLAQPIIPKYDSANEGGYGGAPSYLPTQAYNPLGLEEMHEIAHRNNSFEANVYGQIDLLPSLNYKVNAGYSVWNGFDHDFFPTYYMSTQRQNIRATLGENRARTHHWIIENTLNYQQDFGLHSINFLAGVTAEENHYRNTYAFAEGFPNNELEVLDATTAYSTDISGHDNRWDLYSLLGRFIYSYSDRYYLTANLRRDGTSKFGQVNRYGLFPSVSAGWRVSNESFFDSFKSTIGNLKFRASYGVLGNLPGYEYSAIATVNYSTGLGYLFDQGNNYITGAAIQSFANPEIKWETTRDLDVGFDADFLNNFKLTFDYYLNKTEDVLLHVPIPPSTGTSSAPLLNTGKIQNQGVELSLTYNAPSNDRDFHYSVTGNFSTVRNKVLKLGYAGEVIYGAAPHRASGGISVAQVDYPIGAFFLKQADGLFQSQEEVNNWTDENGNLLQPSAEPGDVRYIDVNSDGIINSSDVAYSGSPFPDFSYGLNFNANYKNFDFTLFLQGTYGNKMFDTNTWITNRGNIDYNFNRDMLDAWTPDNTDTDIPRLTFNDLNKNSDPSTRFLYDATYLRFKTVQIGYTLPGRILNKTGISRLRVYVNGNNLWTLTSYPGYDPSYTGDGLLNRGLDQGLYPIARTITGGIEIHF